jgi:hypothetical protein
MMIEQKILLAIGVLLLLEEVEFFMMMEQL